MRRWRAWQAGSVPCELKSPGFVSVEPVAATMRSFCAPCAEATVSGTDRVDGASFTNDVNPGSERVRPRPGPQWDASEGRGGTAVEQWLDGGTCDPIEVDQTQDVQPRELRPAENPCHGQRSAIEPPPSRRPMPWECFIESAKNPFMLSRSATRQVRHERQNPPLMHPACHLPRFQRALS